MGGGSQLRRLFVFLWNRLLELYVQVVTILSSGVGGRLYDFPLGREQMVLAEFLGGRGHDPNDHPGSASVWLSLFRHFVLIVNHVLNR